MCDIFEPTISNFHPIPGIRLFLSESVQFCRDGQTYYPGLQFGFLGRDTSIVDVIIACGGSWAIRSLKSRRAVVLVRAGALAPVLLRYQVQRTWFG